MLLIFSMLCSFVYSSKRVCNCGVVYLYCARFLWTRGLFGVLDLGVVGSWRWGRVADIPRARSHLEAQNAKVRHA